MQDDFDEREIFDLIRNINDPEHPYTLEQLDVVKIEDVKVWMDWLIGFFVLAKQVSFCFLFLIRDLKIF